MIYQYKLVGLQKINDYFLDGWEFVVFSPPEGETAGGCMMGRSKVYAIIRKQKNDIPK